MTPKRKARVLTQLKINEISSVDVGAGVGCHVVMAKRDRSAALEKFYNRLFSGLSLRKKRKWGYATPGMLKNLDVSVDPDGSIGGAPPDDEDDDGDEKKDNELDKLAYEITRNRKVSTMKRSEELSAIVKRHGLIAVAKQLCEDPHGVSEYEFTQAIVDHAQRVGSTFSKVYCGNDADAITLRKAIEATKHAAWINASGMR